MIDHDAYLVNKPWYQSKKFFAMLIGIVLAILNQFMGLNIDIETILILYGNIAVFIFGQSYVDAKH